MAGRHLLTVWSVPLRVETPCQTDAETRGEPRCYAREPIVDLATGHDVGHEVLTRRPTHGVGAGCQLPHGTPWHEAVTVVEDAVERGWTTGPGALHLNVLARELALPSLPRAIRRLSPPVRSRLVLEVTEHEPLDTGEPTVGAVLGLRALGVRFAVDDFGEGWANLSMVQALVPDILKVTRSTLAGDEPFARWVVQLARSLGAVTVLEQIETPSDLTWARRLGFDCGQGFLWPALPLATPG